jgi:putative addiction module component (TIGR02574 family)
MGDWRRRNTVPSDFAKQTGCVAVPREFSGSMSRTAELVKLPIAERLALIDELWASISEHDLAVGTAQVEEAQARWSELKGNRALGLSYDELKKRLG